MTIKLTSILTLMNNNNNNNSNNNNNNNNSNNKCLYSSEDKNYISYVVIFLKPSHNFKTEREKICNDDVNHASIL